MSILTIVAGPNGSGKSTLTQKLLEDGWDLGEYINPDEIARQLAGGDYREIKGKHTRKAQSLADELRTKCLSEKKPFSFETVMSHESKVEFIQRAKDAGYTVYLHFIGLEAPELNVLRVNTRVHSGGHAVPLQKVRDRYYRSMALLPKAVAAADFTIIYDNSSAEKDRMFLPVATARSGNLVLKIAAGSVRWIRRVFPKA